ncbi:hypothetical protein ABRQ22_14620 [Cellulosimicrobium sp. ES-005]|uniref:Uncharacterized protein n=1 Tax=Cellulosimicrobium sp. ES-005 TaxID=3163031 RepID=A0AAU8FYF2_9MICO
MTDRAHATIASFYDLASELVTGGGGILTAFVAPDGGLTYVASPLTTTPPAVLLGQQAEMVADHIEAQAPVTWILAPTRARGTLWAGKNLPGLRKRRVVATPDAFTGVRLRREDRVVVLDRPRVNAALLLELDLALARASLGHAEVVREVRE